MERLGFYINKKMHYVLVEKTKNKNMYLKIRKNDLVVSAPKNISDKIIKEFVEENIVKFVSYLEDKKNTELYSVSNNFINLLGKKHEIISLTGFKKNSLSIKGKNAYINTNSGDDEEIEQCIKKYLKEDLEIYINKRIIYYEKIMKLREHTVRVVYKTHTWGTNLVGKYKLSFSSRLSHYRREITDYVIVHELAHSIVGNHSTDFWNVVEFYIPNYKELRNELKEDKTLNE